MAGARLAVASLAVNFATVGGIQFFGGTSARLAVASLVLGIAGGR